MTDPQFDNYPIIGVSWTEAQAFAEWAGLDLPTEAQWEKAARGTDQRSYPWGNEAPWADKLYRANLSGTQDGYEFTSPVGAYGLGVSPYGVLDMAGNVPEWCKDWYASDYYSQTPAEGWSNPQGPTNGDGYNPIHVVRGGSYSSGIGGETGLSEANSAFRYQHPLYSPYSGFRVVRPHWGVFGDAPVE